MEPHLKTGLRETTIVIDKETGEVIDTEIKEHQYLASTKEDFFMCYSALIGVFMGMNQAEIRIFGYCLRFVKGLKFDISKKLRISMADEIGINERTILNTIPVLLEKNVLFKHSDGLYQVNPRYAYQGSTSERNKALQAVFQLKSKEC
jgi:hypothetical protein